MTTEPTGIEDAVDYFCTLEARMRQALFHVRMGLLAAAAVLLVAGCGPKNAEEFRKIIGPGTHIVTTFESYEIDRPFKDITATLRQKTKECLDVTVRVICTNCIGNRDAGQQIWKPTFISTPERTELHLQLKRTDVIEIGSPPDGNYEIVLDAIPLGKNRTRIDIYRLRPPTRFIHKAMKGWIKGETAGCPDLASTQ